FGGGGLALDVVIAAAAFYDFVRLLSHNSLLCSRDAVWYHTMKVYWQRFNLFLLLALAVSTGGCSYLRAWFHKPEQTAAMRIHIELAQENVGDVNISQTVSVLRATPVQVTIDKTPILTEASIVAARVIDTPQSPAIEVHFDENGTWILE